MTIQEAIKSKRPFKRHHWALWTWTFVNDRSDFEYKYPADGVGKYNRLDADDICADDWDTMRGDQKANAVA